MCTKFLTKWAVHCAQSSTMVVAVNSVSFALLYGPVVLVVVPVFSIFSSFYESKFRGTSACQSHVLSMYVWVRTLLLLHVNMLVFLFCYVPISRSVDAARMKLLTTHTHTRVKRNENLACVAFRICLFANIKRIWE